MKRCIAILTLVTAMSAGEAFAQQANQSPAYIDKWTPDALVPFEYCQGTHCDADLYLSDDLDALTAIIAFEYGLDAAYLTLLDMGFSDREAIELVQIIAFSGGMTTVNPPPLTLDDPFDPPVFDEEDPVELGDGECIL